MNVGKYLRGEDQHIGTSRTVPTPSTSEARCLWKPYSDACGVSIDVTLRRTKRGHWAVDTITGDSCYVKDLRLFFEFNYVVFSGETGLPINLTTTKVKLIYWNQK